MRFQCFDWFIVKLLSVQISFCELFGPFSERNHKNSHQNVSSIQTLIIACTLHLILFFKFVFDEYKSSTKQYVDTTVEPAGKASSGQGYMQTRLLVQHSGKGSISLVYASKPQVTEQLFTSALSKFADDTTLAEVTTKSRTSTL